MTLRGKYPALLLVAIAMAGEVPRLSAAERAWRRVTTVPAATVSALAAQAGGERLAAASAGSIYLSRDAGRTWSREDRLADDVLALAFAGGSASDPMLLAAGEGGVRWAASGAAGRPVALEGVSRRGGVRALGAAPGAPGRIALGTDNGVVVAGLEGGAWMELATALPGRRVDTLAWSADGSIVAGGEEGLYRFDPARPGSPERLTARPALDVVSSGAASLALTGSGLMATLDGAPWRPLDAIGGPSRRAEAAGSAMDRSGAFIVADAGGVWRVEADRAPLLLADAPPGERTEAIVGLPDGRIFGATDRGLFELPPEGWERSGRPGFRQETFPAPDGLEPVWNSEPGIAAVRRAAIRASHLEPARIRRNFRGVRYRAFLPELELSLRRRRFSALDQDHDQAFTGGALRNLFDRSRDRDSERDFVVAAEWDLASLLFNPDELDVSEEARRVLTLRDDVLDEVNHIYFERRRALLALARLKAGEGEAQAEAQGEVQELKIKIDELAARLDAWTDGFFSRESARLSSLEDAERLR